MSFFDDASLVFLPSGEAGKDGKAYSMKPTDGSGDFTFSRGSNLTATRVDSNGLIEKGRENLLLKSNLFDNGGVPPSSWSTSNASVSSGQSGYDGSSDAWLLQANSDGGGRRLQQSITQGGVSTLSIYAKAGTTDWIRIEFVGASSYVYFDLTNGVLGSETNAIGKIESIGNGWYRCSAVNISGSTPSTMRYILASANNNVNVVTGDNIYIQDAQLEIGLVATEYIESGATTGKAGLLEDSPRFDYSGGASCPSLLLEPSRTNYLGYSEYFDGWNLFNNMTPTANDAISPEGFQNAYKMETTNVGAYFRDAETLTAGDNVFSIFVKRGNSQYIFLRTRFFTGGEEADVWFDVQSGTKGGNLGASVTYDIEDYGNGWYRCYLVHNVDAGDLFGYAYVGLTNTDEDVAGESGLNGYFYGGQWEEGSYPTSYIPNHSGGSVTRNAEAIVINTLDQTYSTDITLFFEVERLVDNADINKLVFLISDASGGGNNIIQFYSTDNGRIRVLIKDDTGSFDNLFSSNNSFIQGTSVKAAIKITQSGCTLFVDGSSVATTSSVGRVLGIDKINYVKDSIIKQFLLFPSALSDANCITLTS